MRQIQQLRRSCDGASGMYEAVGCCLWSTRASFGQLAPTPAQAEASKEVVDSLLREFGHDQKAPAAQPCRHCRRLAVPTGARPHVGAIPAFFATVRKTGRTWCLVATAVCGAGVLLCGVGVASAVARDTRATVSGQLLLGRSQRGRPITAVRRGSPSGLRVLVIGCIHGNESAGIAVARSLERAHTNADLLIVPDFNPDGYAAGTRQDYRGVDLNRNWSSQWQRGGRPWDFAYPGPHPFSERETRIARSLILRFRPRVTIWFHQHMNLVWAWGPSTRAGRLYAHAARMRFYHHPWLNGTAVNWQNHRLPGSSAFVVELPAGSLSPAQVAAQVAAILRLAASIHGPARA